MSTNSSVTSREGEDLQAPSAAEICECNCPKKRFKKRGLSHQQRSCTAIPSQDDRPNTSEQESEVPNDHLNNTAIFIG